MSGINDVDNFYAADPNGVFIGYLGDEPISFICAFKYVQNHGFIRLYLVKKKYRQKGYGLKIFNHAMKYLDGCNVGLNGVLPQIHHFERFGFKIYHSTQCFSIPGLN